MIFVRFQTFDRYFMLLPIISKTAEIVLGHF